MKIRLSNYFSYLFILGGALLASFSVACILLPNDAIDYGTAGIAIILSKVFGFNLSITVILVFIPFLLAGAIYLGKKFTVKAFFGALVYSVGLSFFEEISFELNTEHFIAVAFGGAILGLGLSIILRAGGCIDGSEILANIILKKITDITGQNYSMSSILLGFNILVYGAVFVLIDRNAALMSLLVYVVASIIIDKFTDHFEAIKQATIITKNPDNIVKSIKKGLNKTCTIIQSKGAIAGSNYTVICYVNYFELQKLRDIIAESDEAFTTISTIEEVLR